MLGAIGTLVIGFACFALGFIYGYVRAHNDLLEQIDKFGDLVARTDEMQEQLRRDLDEVKEMRDRVGKTLAGITRLAKRLREARHE